MSNLLEGRIKPEDESRHLSDTSHQKTHGHETEKGRSRTPGRGSRKLADPATLKAPGHSKVRVKENQDRKKIPLLVGSPAMAKKGVIKKSPN